MSVNSRPSRPGVEYGQYVYITPNIRTRTVTYMDPLGDKFTDFEFQIYGEPYFFGLFRNKRWVVAITTNSTDIGTSWCEHLLQSKLPLPVPPLEPGAITAAVVNKLIKDSEVDTSLVSDNYHTFGELYEHRITLFIALAKQMQPVIKDGQPNPIVWRSRKHSDGSSFPGFFIMGIFKEPGHQITYHLPDSKWDGLGFAETLMTAPEWDGHTSKDVLSRLENFGGRTLWQGQVTL